MERPNILIIMCDQLNASVLGCYGGPVPTPNIDQLAQDGVLFINAVCPTPACSPSRASMLTGLYPHTHGIVHNVNRRDYPTIPAPETEEGIHNSDVTTEKHLNAAGYATHQYGKWHLLDDDLDYYPDMFLEHSTYEDVMRDRFTQVRATPPETWMNWYNWALPVTGSQAYRQAVAALGNRWKDIQLAEFVKKLGRLDLPLEETFDYMVADRTVAALRRLDDRPFMITCSFNEPHDPNVVPSPYYEMFDPAAIELPSNFEALETRFASQWSRRMVADLGEAGVREFMRVYYACVKLIDDQVGRILEALEATGRADDTIVLFTADHGDMCGGHGMVWKSTDSFCDEVARIPFVVRYPREVEPGSLDIPCNMVDVMPTLLEFSQHPVPAHAEGTSLVPFLRGERPPQDAPPYTFCERMAYSPDRRREIGPERPGSFMIRGRKWKYCRYQDGEEFLYRLADDPGETTNLVSDLDCQQYLKGLSHELDCWLATRR